MHKPIIIAIDGPAASGKGTIAQRLAEYFDLDYLDTGSIYRALGYKLIEAGHDPSDEKAATEIAQTITATDLNNPDLYNEGVGKAASIVAVIPKVREILLKFQKDFLKNPKGAVLDGRDIGTVICPNADFKFFITANLEARAQRRYKQLQNDGKSVIYQGVVEDLQRRDERDSGREVAPLTKAEDAICIDTTDMPVDEVFEKIVSIITNADERNPKTRIL